MDYKLRLLVGKRKVRHAMRCARSSRCSSDETGGTAARGFYSMDPMHRRLNVLLAQLSSWVPTLDRYVLWRFFAIYVANTICFTVIYVLVDLVNNLERFAHHTEGFMSLLQGCLGYYFAMLPVTFCQILGPVAAVASALFTVTSFQRANEFVPILATGRSYQRTLLPIVVASLFLSVGLFLVQELWIPRTVEAIRQAQETREGEDILKNIKHFDEKRGNFVVIRRYPRFQNIAEGVLVLPVSPHRHHQNQALITAKEMEWTGNQWMLKDVTVQEYDRHSRLVIGEKTVITEKDGEETTIPMLSEHFDERPLETRLTPEDLEMYEKEPVYLSLADLRRKIEDAPNANQWLTKYMARFSSPLANFILVLLGLPVIVFYGNRNVFVGAMLAVTVATVYFLIHSFFQELGVRGYLPVRLAAWLAPCLFIALGATNYRRMQS